MDSIFIKKFKENRQWQDFTGIYLNKTRLKGTQAGFLKTAVADEDLWPFIIASLGGFLCMPVFVITATYDRAIELLREIKIISGGTDVFLYPAYEKKLLLRDAHVPEDTLMQRSEALKKFSGFHKNKDRNTGPFIAIATAKAVMDKVAPLSIISKSSLEIKCNVKYKRQELIDLLVLSGYQRVNKVFDRGEFSFKGDVADIFDIASKNPYRIDFSDDTAVKIFTYKIDEPNTIDLTDKITIFCNHDLSISSAEKKSALVSILDFLNDSVKEYCLVVCDRPEVNLKIKSDFNILAKTIDEIPPISKDKVPENAGFNMEDRFVDPGFMEDTGYLMQAGCFLDLVSAEFEAGGSDIFVFSKTFRQKRSTGNAAGFINNLKKDLENKRITAISMDNLARIKKIEGILTDAGLSFKNHFNIENTGIRDKHGGIITDFNPGIINVLNQDLLSGFESDDFSLYGELDIYEQLENKETGFYEADAARRQFEPGDYVVHKNHGIGRYLNLVSEMTDGNKKEFFLIEYANNDRLFVPVWQSDRIHKYTGEKVPAVTALNSRQWENLKTRVRSSIQKLAVDLASLYAVRDAAKGFAFTADDIWQKEMEDLFPFTETKDQARAIDTVKELMALERPMDLLVCGDVGFGKTEVAIRSAFKAIENGKQVLMLVPTTILADQHSKTFKERYGNFPVIVEVISRFKTPGQQKDIIKRFEEKKVDMLIGTHRILSEDIKPADLGLIIVDEEQRFGVNAKEKLKLLKKNVDVLTLTATPIPRTLYMSLSGIRDMVLIQTYPLGRFPIETFAGAQSEIVIKMAIEREIRRGGQVYFVHNRISDIYEKLYRLQSRLPGIKIAVTHGRMEGAEIENIMQKFVDREYDVLLSTSIIESGMDISNVNTLIVENAHRFGLAQLYQLRGRVGRSSEKAYAYFFYPDRSQLNQAAFQRLKTLTEHTELGSGYKVAMKDLEIRGAGELLGARQHGHINSIGFELYCQIIKEEVDRLKGVEVAPDLNVHIDLPVSAYIPKNYITKEKDRIDIYKSLGSATELDEVNGIEKNMQRRHGLLPEVAKNLLNIAVIKLKAKKSGIEQVVYLERKGLVFKKIMLSEKNAKDLINKNPGLIYLPKNREVIVKKTFKELNLHLVINYLNDIIAFI